MPSSFKHTAAKPTPSKRKRTSNKPSQKLSKHQSSSAQHHNSSIFSTPEPIVAHSKVAEVVTDSVASAKTPFTHKHDMETPRQPRMPVPFPDIEDLASPCKPDHNYGPVQERQEMPFVSQEIEREQKKETCITVEKPEPYGSMDEKQARRHHVDAVDPEVTPGMQSSETMPHVDKAIWGAFFHLLEHKFVLESWCENLL